MVHAKNFLTRHIWTALLPMLMLAVVACVPITPPAQTPAVVEETPATVTETVPEAVPETVTATVPAEEESEEEESGEMADSAELSGVLTGTVTYLQRIALPAGSVIEVSLRDVSLQDVAATEITSQTITTACEQVPVPFELNYDPAQIDSRMSYALNVRITIEGQLRWINTEQIAVLTQGAPLTGIEVVVQPAR